MSAVGPWRLGWVPRPRTLRMRLAVLYGALFLVSGVALLAIPNAFVGSSSTVRASVPGSGADLTPLSPGLSRPSLADTQRGHDIDRYVTGSVVALVALVLLSVGLGWLLSGRLLRPLRTITATAGEMSAASLGRRLALRSSGDELTRLGRTLDDLFARLEASFQAQQHFVANASHELRTPLAAERTLLQVALADPDADATTLRAACEQALLLGAQQARLMEALFTLATGERGIQRREDFDLAEVAAGVLDRRSGEAAGLGIRVEADLGPAPVSGDRDLAEILLDNLVDNALRHNVPGGHLGVRTTTDAGRARLDVANSGAAVPAAEVDRLFEPFQRLGAPRTRTDDAAHGHGLGLAIVRAATTAHAATITATPRSTGGLDLRVDFPPRNPTAPPNRS
ncbi:sensor histidine kinase [Actinacidiphila yanglinensis]|uniref:sensor histidine kinase n=1 Tax=Actinacidiphila yanglinensis TaxID=310779 RepID=UPI001F31DA09|nr:HAMP domain-containing sensor histidine kinase [Actinacidiphila yanglinensis]